MLSDEEKKAIEDLKRHIIPFKLNDTLLDLIEKQQKEIEELKKYEEGYKLLTYSLNNYISKDKIKSILEKYKYTEIGNSEKIIEFYKKIQSLLEKE